MSTTPAANAAKDDELQWWREEAERINRMSSLARTRGVTTKVGDADNPPRLNPDGSLYDPATVANNYSCPDCGAVFVGNAASHFASCKRDAKGHCLPGQGGASTEGKQDETPGAPKARKEEGGDEPSPKSGKGQDAPAVKYPPGFSAPSKDHAPNPHLPNEARPELTKDQAQALRRYSDEHVYGPLNKSLREGKEPSGTAGRVNDQLNAAFDRAKPLPEPVPVRHAKTIPAEDVANWKEFMENAAKSGQPFAMTGHTSTTANPSNPGYNGNVVFKINATHGLDMKPYGRVPGEDEFLIQHGAKFKVERVEETTGSKGGKILTVTVTQLPPERHDPKAEAKRPGLLGRAVDRLRDVTGNDTLLQEGVAVPPPEVPEEVTAAGNEAWDHLWDVLFDDAASSLVPNYNPGQPRKPKGGKGGGQFASGSHFSGGKAPKTGESLTKHIVNSGGPELTDLQRLKISLLNPEGTTSGVVRVPMMLTDPHIKHLKRVLPKGTEIVKVNAGHIKAGDKKGEGKGDDPQGAKPPKAVRPPAEEVKKITSVPYSPLPPAGIQGTGRAYVKAHAEAVLANLTKAEKEALSYYTAEDSEVINKAMRGCPPEFECVKGEYGKKMKRIMSALEKAPAFDSPVSVVRTIHVTGKDRSELIASMMEAKKSGTEFSLPSFTSTTHARKPIFDDQNTEFRIKARTGLYIDSLSEEPGEHEILLHPRARFKVRQVRAAAGRTIIHLEELL